MQLVNVTSRQLVDVPDAQVQDAFLSGQFGFKQGDKIPVVSPDGQPGTIDAADAHSAFTGGYTYDPATVNQAQLQADYGTPGQQALTGLESAASGATLGLSRVAERAVGVDPEAMRKRREANPITAIGGEVAGAVLPAVLTWGGSAPATGAELALTGANVARMAAAPVRAVTAVGRAVEAAGLLRTATIASPAAKFLANTAVKAGASAVEGALYAAGQVVDEAALGDPDLNAEHALSTIGMGAVLGGAVGAVTSLAGKALSTSIPKGTLPKGTSSAALEDYAAARTVKGVVGQGGPKIKWTRQIDKYYGGPEELGKTWQELGIGALGNGMDKNLDIAKSQVDRIGTALDGTYTQLDQLAGQTSTKVLPAAKDFVAGLKQQITEPLAGRPIFKKTAEAVSGIIDDYADKFNAAGKPLTFADLWGMQRDLGEAINWAQPEMKLQNKLLARMRGEIRQTIMESAERTSVANGVPNLADELQSLNKQYSAAALAKDIATDKLAGAEANRTFSLSDHLWGLGGATAGALSANPLGFLAGLGTMVANKMMREQGNQLLAAGANKLARIQDAILRNQQAVTGAVRAAIVPGSGGARPFVPLTLDLFRAAGETNRSAYDRHWNDLKVMQANPDVLMDRLGKPMTAMNDIAPALSMAMQSKAADAIQFLIQKAPQDPNGMSTPGFDRPWVASESTIAKWGRYWDAVQNPIGALEKIKDGTLAPEDVEVLRTLYPGLHQQAVRSAFNALADKTESLPYRTRVQLSMLVGAPLERTLAPAFQQGLAGVWQRSGAEGKAAGAGPQGPAPGGHMPDITHLSQGLMTESQRIASR